MSAGKKSDLIVIQAVTISQDEYGAQTESWAQAFEVWSEYQAAGSREFPSMNKRQSETTARFIIWYRLDIHAATHRILFDSKVWNISEPSHDRKRSETTIEASEIS